MKTPCMATLMSEFKRIRPVCVKKKGKKTAIEPYLRPCLYGEKLSRARGSPL